jgi:predicted enzyme related to lactoylglutathione lyase
MDRTIVHFEIPADEPERVAEFYRDLFGWSVTKSAMDDEEYWLVTTASFDDAARPARRVVDGGIVRRRHRSRGFVSYVQVEDVEQYAAYAVGLGGGVVVPRTPVTGMGWFACLEVPEGNVFGVWQTDSGARQPA